MRWIKEKPPKEGATKICKHFAILPYKIDNETRWLEYVTIKYRYYEDFAVWEGHKYLGAIHDVWVPIEFVDDEV